MMGLVHSPVPPKKELPPPFAPEEGFALIEFVFCSESAFITVTWGGAVPPCFLYTSPISASLLPSLACCM